MKLTQRLLSYLPRFFRKEPVEFLALRLRYDGTLAWTVEDGVLRTTVTSQGRVPPESLILDFVLQDYAVADLPWDHAINLEVDLTQHTLGSLATFLAAQPGYSVEYRVTGEASQLGARILMDASGDQALSNGDHLNAFTSLTWVFLDAAAVELKAAREQIYQMLRQMAVPTAEGEWLDEIGGYYGVPRREGEIDSLYGPRIIDEVIRPRNNNKALEIAISKATGGLKSKVTDVREVDDMFPIYDGVSTHNGVRHYDAEGTYRRNLFDVEYSFDLLGSEDIGPFQARVLELINDFRSAGTHLRQILLTSGLITDDVPFSPTETSTLSATVTATDSVDAATDSSTLDSSVAFTDSASLPTDGDPLISYKSLHTYDGQQYYGGQGRAVNYDSGETVLYDAPTLELNFLQDDYRVEV